jgi:hypothetical protein
MKEQEAPGIDRLAEQRKRRQQRTPPEAGGIPFMITAAMKEALRARGYSDDDIANMTPTQAHEILGPQQQQKHERFTLKPFHAIAVSTRPNYRVKGILPRTGLAVIWGPPKCGKSFWTYDLVMHIAIGRPYRGRKVQQGTVVYCALEGGAGFAGRVEAWRQLRLAEHDQAVPFYLLDVPIDLIAEHKAIIAAIHEQVSTPPAVVVIDTLNRAIAGDENKSDDMAKFIKAADAIRAEFDCLVIIVHHCGVVGTRPRGHTSLAGADDCQIAVEKNKDGIITATVEHMKDAEAGTSLASILEPIDLGTDTEGDPLSSCVISPTDAGTAEQKLTKTQRFAFDLLQKLIAKEGIAPPAEAKLAQGQQVIHSEIWRKAFYDTYPADKQDTKKKALLRATLDLTELKLIELWREFVWIESDT